MHAGTADGDLPALTPCASVFEVRKVAHPGKRRNSLRFVILAGLLVIACVAGITAGQRIHLEPKFFAGETLRYRIVTRMSSKGETTTPIANPEGGTEQKLATRMVVRLDVLAAPASSSAAPEGPGAVRLRATYETSEASYESDAVNPGAPSVTDEYQRLQGHSIEFTIGPGGLAEDFKGLDEILPNQTDAASMISWTQGLSVGAGLPKRGIEIGEKWSNERPLTGMPLTEIVWRTQSTYLRDEICGSSAGTDSGANTAAAKQETCAVILTRFEIFRHGSSHSDATPEDYRRNGLRTQGKWSGSGESLNSISRASGLLVNSTQSSTQDMDYEIVSNNTGSRIHRVARVTTQTEITLLPPDAPKS